MSGLPIDKEKFMMRNPAVQKAVTAMESSARGLMQVGITMVQLDCGVWSDGKKEAELQARIAELESQLAAMPTGPIIQGEPPRDGSRVYGVLSNSKGFVGVARFDGHPYNKWLYLDFTEGEDIIGFWPGDAHCELCKVEGGET